MGQSDAPDERASGPPKMDLSGALELVGGDSELLREIAEIYLEDYAQRLTELDRHIDAGDLGMVARVAHSVKGAVANFAAEEAVEAALKLELAARGGDTALLPACRARLVEALDGLASALRELVDD